MATIIALDVGERRIGVASADTGTRLAVPAGVIERRGSDADWDAVLQEAESRATELIVVGMPLSLNGRRGPQAQVTEAFVNELRSRTAIPIETWDERYSTAEAQHRMRSARPDPGRGKPDRDARGRIDAAAATVILQSYLDAH